MKPPVGFFDLAAVQMGVDLRGGQRRMPQKLLNRAQVGPALQKVRGEGVPENVGIDRRFKPGCGGRGFDLSPKLASPEPATEFA